MSTSITATVDSDISYSFIKTGLKRVTETGTTGFSYTFTNGTGSGNADYAVIISGTLASGAKTSLDFGALPKDLLDASDTIGFDQLKYLMVKNNSTGYGQNLNIHATGDLALTEIFNGGSGNLVINPYAAHQYGDPISGVVVSQYNKELTLMNAGTSDIVWSAVVVGESGVAGTITEINSNGSGFVTDVPEGSWYTYSKHFLGQPRQDCVRLGTTTETDVSGDFSISCWIKPVDHLNRTIIGDTLSNYIRIDGKYFYLRVGSSLVTLDLDLDRDNRYPLNTWHYIAVTRVADTGTVYYNNNTGVYGSVSSATDNMKFDRFPTYGATGAENAVFRGNISDIRIYNYGLSESERGYLMSFGTSGVEPTGSLWIGYPLDGDFNCTSGLAGQYNGVWDPPHEGPCY